ncbi:nudix hydrolase 22, chloroplastic-like [Mercurialis annua]|uniref:nudix hydrolase 22, chloroplastic-like n=1 Tax=Mercurialis annua TaxID=3986 RepID=UPI00215F663D|nr:nudix hydrolase 22, chloroplastic-like [Mercurialis annua]
MDSINIGEKSPKLISLAQQLHLYKPDESRTTVTVQELDSAESAKPITRAAVLICIFEGNDGELRVILTKRSSTLSSHSGEVALPGGKREEGDADDVETALREAKEEIGLDPSLVDVVAVLEPFVTLRSIAVVPVIGILFDRKAFTPSPNSNEVESIFDVPLEMFLKDENRRAVEKERMGHKYLLHFFDYQSENESYVIWALTAGIMITVASVVYQRQPAFLEQKPPFWSRTSQSDIPKL